MDKKSIKDINSVYLIDVLRSRSVEIFAINITEHHISFYVNLNTTSNLILDAVIKVIQVLEYECTETFKTNLNPIVISENTANVMLDIMPPKK